MTGGEEGEESVVVSGRSDRTQEQAAQGSGHNNWLETLSTDCQCLISANVNTLVRFFFFYHIVVTTD